MGPFFVAKEFPNPDLKANCRIPFSAIMITSENLDCTQVRRGDKHVCETGLFSFFRSLDFYSSLNLNYKLRFTSKSSLIVPLTNKKKLRQFPLVFLLGYLSMIYSF